MKTIQVLTYQGFIKSSIVPVYLPAITVILFIRWIFLTIKIRGLITDRGMYVFYHHILTSLVLLFPLNVIVHVDV